MLLALSCNMALTRSDIERQLKMVTPFRRRIYSLLLEIPHGAPRTPHTPHNLAGGAPGVEKVEKGTKGCGEVRGDGRWSCVPRAGHGYAVRPGAQAR